MYGYFNLKEAEKLAEEKTTETGTQHVVLPAELRDGPPGKYTIGVEVKGTTLDEILNRIKSKAK